MQDTCPFDNFKMSTFKMSTWWVESGFWSIPQRGSYSYHPEGMSRIQPEPVELELPTA